MTKYDKVKKSTGKKTKHVQSHLQEYVFIQLLSKASAI